MLQATIRQRLEVWGIREINTLTFVHVLFILPTECHLVQKTLLLGFAEVNVFCLVHITCF